MDNTHTSRDVIINHEKNIVMDIKCSDFYWIGKIV